VTVTKDTARAAVDRFRDREPGADDLVLLPEFAEMTRQPEATIRWLLHRGDLPMPGKIGRRLVWRRSQVDEYIARSFDRPGQVSA
jgi:predicted DNA-binding transcriptional regulator AlpA